MNDTALKKRRLMNSRSQLKRSYKTQLRKKEQTEKKLNRLKFDTMVKYNNKLNSIANRIDELTFYLSEL